MDDDDAVEGVMSADVSTVVSFGSVFNLIDSCSFDFSHAEGENERKNLLKRTLTP